MLFIKVFVLSCECCLGRSVMTSVMNNVDILSFLGPIVPLLFAGTFFVFWLGQRNAPHILLTGISLVFFAASLILGQYFFETLDAKMVVTTTSVQAVSLIIFAHAMSLRLNLKTPMFSMCAVSIIGLSVSGFLSTQFEALGPRLLAASFTFAALLMIGAMNMLRAAEQTRVNYTLIGVIILIALSTVGSSLITWNMLDPVPAYNYKQSVYWKTLNFSAAIMSIILSMTLIVAFANDLVLKIKMLSDIDVLTGVKTRRAFDLEAQAIFAQHARSNLPISLIVTDLDHFKKINDKSGHLVGDRVLSTFGETMSKALRATDIIGRVGGEEFCIILWNTSEDGAVFVAEGLRSRLEAADIKGLPAGSNVTASFGVVEVSERESFESAFERADKSMYFAKQTGRNRVCVGNKVSQTPSLSCNYDDQYWSDTVRETSLN